MSTEATGDGQTDAGGAVEPDVAAEGAEPAAATAVAEPGVTEAVTAEAVVAAPTAWGTEAPSAWGTPELADRDVAESAALVPSQAAAPNDAAAADDALVADSVLDEESVSSAEAGGTAQADDAAAAEALGSGEAAEAGEAAETDDASVPDEAARADQSLEGAEASESSGVDEALESAEPDAPGEVGEPDETDDSGEADEYDEDYSDDYADDEAPEYDEEYDEDEPQEVAEPQRARRWPRVLLALGFVVLAAVIVGGAIAIVGSVTHGFKKPVKVTYKKSALFSLRTGECFDPQGQSYSLVSCDAPHVAEVFATFTLSGTKWPGATAIAAEASSGCAGRLTGYLNPQLAISLASTYVYPDSVAWQAGTRTVICEVRASSGELTGSVRGASASAG